MFDYAFLRRAGKTRLTWQLMIQSEKQGIDRLMARALQDMYLAGACQPQKFSRRLDTHFQNKEEGNGGT